jgi:hypothetical protein
VWVKQLGGTGNDISYGIALDAAGNVHSTGYFEGTADFDPGLSIFNLVSAGVSDIFISKLDGNGNYLWAKRMGSTGSESGYSLVIDASGNVLTTGFFNGTVDFDPNSGTSNLVSAGGADIFIQKLTSTGTLVWARKIGGSGNDFGKCIDTDPSGNVFSTGGFNGSVDFDPGTGTFSLTAPGGNYDIYISKLNSSGNFVWARNITSSAFSDFGNGIDVDAAGYIYTTGFFGGTADFDPGVATYTLPTVGLQDAYVNCLDASGNFVWAKGIGSTSNDNGNAIKTDNSGNIYFTGAYQLTPNFDPGTGTFTMTSNGLSDIFVEKLFQLTPPTITASPSPSFCAGNSVTLATIPATSYTWSNGSNNSTVSIGSAGNYSVTVTLSACAVTSSAITLYSIALPTVGVNSGSICNGNSFTINPTGASTYTYANGGPVVSPTISSSYSVTGTSTAGCVSSNTAVSNVTVISLPIITVNSGSICSGNSFTMVPGGAVTYTFSSGPIVSPTATSAYSVTGTSSVGCIGLPAVSDVTVNAFPLPSVTVNSGSICSGSTFTLIPSGAISYTYSSGSPL